MGLFGLIREGYGRLYDHLEDVRQVYEEDHTMTESDYIYPGCLLKANVVAESAWMEGKYPQEYRMRHDQRKLDWYREIDHATYQHKDYE